MFYCWNCYSLNEYFANIIYDKIDYGIKIIFIFFLLQMESSIMNTLQYDENEEFKNTWPSTFNNTFSPYENESTNDTFGTNCIIDIFYR